MQKDLPQASVPWLDDLMQTDASAVLLDGVQRWEPVPRRPEGWRYCYFPHLDVGPYRVQVRLTVVISPPETGRVDIEVVEINPGVMDLKTGEVEFQEDPRELVEASCRVAMRWRPAPRRGGVTVAQEVLQKFKLKVPWWFPVPDAATEAALRPFIQQAIRSSAQGVVQGLRDRAAAPARRGQSAAAVVAR